MKKILLDITPAATSAITATSADQLAYLCNVKRLSQWCYTGPRYLLSHNTTPANWSTMHESLADGFITKYADPLCLLGVGFGLVTAYIMFDIDRGSPNHPSNDPRAFQRFLATLCKIGLTTPVIIQSSYSGGIHVYYFFDRDINTFRIAALSQITLIDAKFDIKDGTLELFPDCKPYGQKSNHKPHRSPLQPNGGGLILDRKGNPLLGGENFSYESQLAAFLELAKESARGNDIDKIQQKLDPGYAKFKSIPSKYQYAHKKNESEVVKEWRNNLEILMSVGWTAFHQTNELIQRFIEYGVVFMKLNNKKDLFEWAFEAITNANGYGKYCRHQHEIEPRILDWIELTLEKEFYVPYCGHPTRSSDRNNFICEYKHSKSKATTKLEVYLHAKVELVSTKISIVVDTILGMIDQIPSRTEDLIQMIHKIAREKFGHSFSNTTLYKEHYHAIWMKLKSTKKVSDMVVGTLNTSTNIVYQTETPTEKAFEGLIFDVTESSETNLKPIGGETSHRAPCVCSVNASSPPIPANEVDPDLIPVPDLKDTTFNLIDSQSALLDLDISYQADSIKPPGADLVTRSTHNYPQPIYPNPTNPDPIQPQSPTNPNFIDSDSNPQSPEFDEA